MKKIMLEKLDNLLSQNSRDSSLSSQSLSMILDSLSMMKFASMLKIKHEIDVFIAEMTFSNVNDLTSRKTQSIDHEHSIAFIRCDSPNHEKLLFEEQSDFIKSCVESILQNLDLS